MADAERRQYGTLDGLRGVAAIAVVVVHAPFLFAPIPAVSAGLAVDLFFVMSGFIIAHAYEAKLLSGLSGGRFIILRLIRLYPLYLLGLMIGVAQVLGEISFGSAQLWTFRHLGQAIAAGLLMLPSTASPHDVEAAAIFPLNPPSWSLFFEVVVNIAYALLACLLRTRVLLVVVAIAGLALLVLGIRDGDLHFGSHWHNFGGGFARVAYSFGTGVLIYRLARHGVPFRIHSTIILAVCGMIFLIDPGAYTGIYELACVLVILPALVVLGISTEPVGRLRSTFSFLGLISYGVYCLHFPLVLGVKGVLQKLTGSDISYLAPWTGIAFLAVLILLCWIVDKAYDAPVRKLLAGLGKARQTAKPTKAET